MRFKLSVIFSVIIMVVCAAFAQVDLMGKVLDRNNNPVNGVIATLSGIGVSDTTGSDGVYHLIDGTGIKVSQGDYFKNGWKNSRLLFSVHDKQRVSIDIYNLKGKKVASVFNKSLPGGYYSIVLGIPGLAIQIHIIKLQIGQKASYYKVLNVEKRKGKGLTRLGGGCVDETFVASSRYRSDTLLLLKDGQIISAVEILDLIDTLPDVFIVQRDINGALQVTGDTISKIEAVITGDSIPDSLPKVVELWHNVANNSFSRFVYFLHSLKTINYNVFVKIHDNGGKFIGRSMNVPFNSLAGNIEVPLFDLDNAKPTVSLGNDTTVSIKDTIYFKAVVVDSFRIRDIVKWEWNIDGSGFIEGSGDIVVVAPDSFTRMGQIVVVIKVTDVDSNTAIDEKIVTVVQDIPIPTASIIAGYPVWAGDSIQLKGVAADIYGRIVKWEWCIVGDFIEITTSDTTVFPVVGNNEYVLRVTDDDGNVAVDTVVIRVYGMNDKMSLIYAKGEIFLMGQDGIGDTVHQVTFTYDFWMDTAEVSQKDYSSIMGVNPSYHIGNSLPVEQVTWFDAVLYCNARSKLDGFDSVYSYDTLLGVAGDSCYELTDLSINFVKNGYRLPTEAEWEFACRATTTTEYYWGSAIDGNYVWYCENSGNETHPIGTKLPNIFRLYNMSGNVFEWVNDWYSDYYGSELQIDPIGIGPGSGIGRQQRGGDYSYPNLAFLKSAFHSEYRIGFFGFFPYSVYEQTGFRVVRVIN